MERTGKGHGEQKHQDNYCILDLETTDIYISSSEIIEIGVLRVRDNKVVDKFNTLINPCCEIPEEITAKNHISDEMVKDAPLLGEVIDSFIEFVGDDVIVGYNNASFDMNLIYDSYMELRNKPFTNNYIDLLHACRRCIEGLENYKLGTVCGYYHLDTTGEHRALKDCYLTKDVYDRLYNEYGDKAFASKKSDSKHFVRYSAETIALQNLQALLETIIADGKITNDEFSTLKSWVADNSDLQGNYPFDRVFNALDRVLADREVSPSELDELQVLFSDFVDPVKSRGYHEEITSIMSKHIVVTGDFEYGDREEVCSLIEKAGGIIDKGVKKATNYVVVGSKGSTSWKTGNYGSKIQKAMELKDKGGDIEIIEEKDFIPYVHAIAEKGIIEKGNVAGETNPNDLGWKIKIKDMLEFLAEEFELPVGSLYLSDNYGQTGSTKDKIISHTVCIWEPDYPPTPNEQPKQNKIVVNIIPSKIKSRPDDIDLNIRETQEGDLHDKLPADAEILSKTKADIDNGMIRIRFKRYSPNLVNYIRENTIYCIKGYVSKAARFACCSRFTQCSDAKKCIHSNKLYSKACMYRDNLENGRIFYGKNCNVNID